MARTEIGNINDAAERYGTDGAGIWALICGERVFTRRDGKKVMLVADPEKRYGPQGTTWLVEEVEL